MHIPFKTNQSCLYFSLLQVLPLDFLHHGFMFILLRLFEFYQLPFPFSFYCLDLSRYIFHHDVFFLDLLQAIVMLQLFFLLKLVYYFPQTSVLGD
jgi:hypothetical protein